MGDIHMHYQFLVEDRSAEALIDTVMLKIKSNNESVTYGCRSFRGIGGFTKRNTVKETRTGKLLNDLATYLRGFDKSLQHYPTVIVVVLDNDDRDTVSFQEQLKEVAGINHITVDHIFCIAVEKIEAWLLGDEAALLAAYPQAKLPVLHSYVQDSICGTWELLADAIYPGGHQKMIKDALLYTEIGKMKFEWAHNIGMQLNLAGNRSPSFRYFIEEIFKRVPATG